MTHKIDTDMTAAYLRAVQQECEHANETINDLSNQVDVLMENNNALLKRVLDLEEELETTRQQNTALAAAANSSPWQPRDIVPKNEDDLYIVKTKEGAIYFLQPINGKWMDNVVKWCPIPT